jgi:hypothetical protein
MVQDGNGVNIVAEGPNHSLYFYWATNGTSTWHQETVAGANTTYSAPALANIGNGENLAYFGYYDESEGALMFAWSDSSGQFHQELVAAAGVN